MDSYSAVIDAVARVGFPAAVATALAVGLHYWMVRFYRDIGLPLTQEGVRLLRSVREHLARLSDAAERSAAAVERVCDHHKGNNHHS